MQLGSLHPTRDLTYVEDTVAGFVALAECDQAIGKEVNVGSGEEISIGGLADLLMKITESNAQLGQSAERLRPGSERSRSASLWTTA